MLYWFLTTAYCFCIAWLDWMVIIFHVSPIKGSHVLAKLIGFFPALFPILVSLGPGVWFWIIVWDLKTSKTLTDCPDLLYFIT